MKEKKPQAASKLYKLSERLTKEQKEQLEKARINPWPEPKGIKTRKNRKEG